MEHILTLETWFQQWVEENLEPKFDKVRVLKEDIMNSEIVILVELFGDLITSILL